METAAMREAMAAWAMVALVIGIFAFLVSDKGGAMVNWVMQSYGRRIYVLLGLLATFIIFMVLLHKFAGWP